MTKRDLAKMRYHLGEIIRGCRQMIAAGESWADNRPEEQPIDIEWFRTTLATAERALQAVNDGDMELAEQLGNELAEIDTEDAT